MSHREIPPPAADLVSAALKITRHDATRLAAPGDEHWGRMLALAAEVRIAGATGDRELVSALRQKRRDVAQRARLTDHCSTWLDLMVVAELHEVGAAEERDLADARRVAEYVLGLPTTTDGHLAVEGPDGTPWAFTDTVHFALVPLAVLAPEWGRPELREFVREQIDAHVDALVLPEGVAHGASRRGGEVAGVDWGRSTGYLVQGLADAERLGLRDDSRTRDVVRALFDSLAAAQDESGDWHLRPLAREGGPEDSGSAFLLSALAAAGVIDDERIAAGARALVASSGSDDDGLLTLRRVAEEIPIAGIDDYERVRRARFTWGTASFLRLGASLATLYPRAVADRFAQPLPHAQP